MAEIRVRTAVIVATAILVPLLTWLIVDLATVSPSEKIEGILQQLAAASEAGDPEAMVRYVSPGYFHQRLTRQNLKAAAEAYFQRYGKTDVTLRATEVSLQGSLAVANLTVLARAQRGDLPGTWVSSRWQFSFARRGKEWQIVGVTPVAIERLPLEDWQPILVRLGLSAPDYE